MKSLANIFASKDRIVASAVFAVLFCMVAAMVLMVRSSLVEKEALLLKADTERAFNSIYLEHSEHPGSKKTAAMLDEEMIIGMGLYSGKGFLIRSLGSVPYSFPYAAFEKEGSIGTEPALGILNIDRRTGVVRYMRLARLQATLDAGSLVLGKSGRLSANLDFPEVIYLVKDGSRYLGAVRRIDIAAAVSLLVVLVSFVLAVRAFLNNIRYKEMLSRQESLVSLGAAARTLAHEIKNPLSAITIQAALLRKILPEEYRGELDLVDRETARLAHLADRVNDFLKDPLGRPVVIEMRSFLEEIASLFPNKVSFARGSLERAYVRFDRDRARSVFENLVKNASESAPGRDPQVEIELAARKRGKVRVAVLDRGDGLPPADKAKYFDPFFTTKIHGSGIGLSITRRFVKAAGGSVSIKPREGGGARVEVLLASVPARTVRAMEEEE